MVLLVGVAPHVDEGAEILNNLRKAHGDDAVNKFLKDGITENDLNVVAKSGNLLRTLGVVKRADGKVIWLEEGRLKSAAGKALGAEKDIGGTGWIHIQNNHVYLNGVNDFKKAFGAAYDDESLIKELILDCAKTGTLDPRNPVAYWKKVDEGHLLLVEVIPIFSRS
jgi:hypothetical protein